MSLAGYTWRPANYVAVCQINLGRYDEGIRATLRPISLGNPERELLRANLHWAVDQL